MTQIKPEKCPKCGHETFVAKHKGPHIGWYCARCGQWIRWIPKSSIILPEEGTCPPYMPENFSRDTTTDEDDDDLPWE